MTQKELLYVEDAIGHEKNMISIIEGTLDMLQDESLITFLEKELKKHVSMEEKLMNMLEEKNNE